MVESSLIWSPHPKGERACSTSHPLCRAFNFRSGPFAISSCSPPAAPSCSRDEFLGRTLHYGPLAVAATTVTLRFQKAANDSRRGAKQAQPIRPEKCCCLPDSQPASPRPRRDDQKGCAGG